MGGRPGGQTGTIYGRLKEKGEIMKQAIRKHIRSIVAITAAMAMAVAFMPISAPFSHAASFPSSSAVSDLKVTSYTGSTVTLKWDRFSSASGYEIYKATKKNGKYKRIKKTTKTTFKRKDLTANKTCYYKVRAYHKNSDGSKSYSKYSSVVAGTPKRFTDGKIKDFELSSKTYDSVTLSWDSYPEAAGYKVYKATKENGKYKKIATVKGTSFKRTDLTTNKTCYYKVRAYKKSKKGKRIHTKYTSPVKGTPSLKTPSLTASSSSSGVTLTWTSVTGASGYQVYRATSEHGDYDKVETTSSRKYTTTKIDKNKNYYFKVRAYRKVNGDKKTGSFSGPELGVKVYIPKVSSVAAKSKDDCVALSWKSISGASGYQIYRASGSSSNYTNVGTASSASFNDYNVANKVTYYYKVRAYKEVNGTKVYGGFSSVGYSRSAVVSAAVAWLGCKESNKSNKPIIDLYNKNMGTKFSYTTPWCAMFVSAVAIKTKTTSIIVRGSYCPSVINVYKNSKIKNYSYGKGSKYKPKAGDVIFFDWNRNGVPDHTGLVATVSGNTIKTIEGNYHDAVGYRTFSVGYRYVLGYGLPNYDDANGIVYTGKSNSSVGCGELTTMGIGMEPEGYEDLGSEYDTAEENIDEGLDEKEDMTDYEKMELMIEKARESAETDGIDCSETQYYAAFIYKLCTEEDEDLEASIMTMEDEEGTTHAWVEVCLDDKWYKVDASKESDQITEFTPDSTDVEGEAVESNEEEMEEGAAAADEEANGNIDGVDADVASEGDWADFGAEDTAEEADADTAEDADADTAEDAE